LILSKNVLKKKYYKLCGTPYYMAPEIILNIDEFEDIIDSRITC
jgi:serine/threonine protein kinase